jgi:hypothetical protein
VRSSICGRSFGDRDELWGKVSDDVLAAVALFGGDTRLLDQCPAALVPVAIGGETALGPASCRWGSPKSSSALTFCWAC